MINKITMCSGAPEIELKAPGHELLSNLVYEPLTSGGFPADYLTFINAVDELHAGNHISDLSESS